MAEPIFIVSLSHMLLSIRKRRGLDFDICDIIEIGAVRVEDGEIADTFDSLVNIGYEVGSFIMELTGITDKMLEEAPRLNDVISKFEAFAGDSVLLAHNASFESLCAQAHNDSNALDAIMCRVGAGRQAEGHIGNPLST